MRPWKVKPWPEISLVLSLFWVVMNSFVVRDWVSLDAERHCEVVVTCFEEVGKTGPLCKLFCCSGTLRFSYGAVAQRPQVLFAVTRPQ